MSFGKLPQMKASGFTALEQGALIVQSRFAPRSRTGAGRMDVIEDYLRDQATKYRQLADKADDDFVKKELIELASVCEEVANDIGDRLTAG